MTETKLIQYKEGTTLKVFRGAVVVLLLLGAISLVVVANTIGGQLSTILYVLCAGMAVTGLLTALKRNFLTLVVGTIALILPIALIALALSLIGAAIYSR